MEKLYVKPLTGRVAASVRVRLLSGSNDGMISANVKENPGKEDFSDPNAEGIGVGKNPVSSFDF